MEAEKRTTMNGRFLEKVPVVLFNEIRDFCYAGDYYKLVTVTKRFFSGIKQETWRIMLSNDQVFGFLNSQSKRTAFLRKIRYPKLQLQICIYDDLLPDGLKKLLSTDCQSIILDATHLHCVPSWVQLISMKQKIRLLRGNAHVKNFEGLEREKGEHIRRLYITNFSQLNDVSHLKCLQHLVLDKCPAVVDVNCLSTIFGLTLRNCQQITDVSPLGRVHSLTLHHCHGILDISSLTHNYSLTILTCSRISGTTANFVGVVRLVTDLIFDHESSSSALQANKCMKFLTTSSIYNDNKLFIPLSLHTVSICYFKNLDLSNFCCLFKVSFSYFTNIDLTPLFSVSMVELCDNGLKTCQGLGGNRWVRLHCCHDMEDYSSLANVPTVILSKVPIHNYDLIHFQNCQDISLINCSNTTSLVGLENVPVVSVHCCGLNAMVVGNRQKIVLDIGYEKLLAPKSDWQTVYDTTREEHHKLVLFRK
jgi:hypothetical protein